VRTWALGPRYLALRTWVSGSQREVSGPGSQDLGFRPSTRGFRTWIWGPGYQALGIWLSAPGFQDLESSPSYGRLIFFPSLFSASSGHRRTDARTDARTQEVTLYIRLVSNRDGRTQSARVGCCCIWLSGPEFQDLDIWLSGPGFQDLGCCCIWLSGPGFQDLDKRALGFTLRTWVSGPRKLSILRSSYLFPVTFLCVHRHFSLRPVVTDARTHGRNKWLFI
jgi:hypothetical protein